MVLAILLGAVASAFIRPVYPWPQTTQAAQLTESFDIALFSIHSLFISRYVFLSRLSRRPLVISLLITAILSRPAGVQRPGHRYCEGDPGGKKGGAASYAGHRGTADQLLRNRLQGHGPTDRNRHISFSFSALTEMADV